MYPQTKTHANYISIAILTCLAFIFLSLTLRLNPTPEFAFAHEAGPLLETNSVTQNASLAAFQGLGADLQISQQVIGGNLAANNTITVTAGTQITYVVRIDNTGFFSATSVLFVWEAPEEFQKIGEPQFEREAQKVPKTPQWLFKNQFEPNASVKITVTGILTSLRSTTAKNLVEVETTSKETNTSNNTNELSIKVVGLLPELGPTYLPVLLKQPPPPTSTPTSTPTPTHTKQPTATFTATAEKPKFTYYENFDSPDDDDDANWLEKKNVVFPDPEDDDDDGDGKCDFEYRDGKYRIEADPYTDDDDDNKPKADDATQCFGGAPKAANFKFGSAEVVGSQINSGESGKTANVYGYYGIYINGSGGRDYYTLLVSPSRYLALNSDDNNKNDCKKGGSWIFLRLKSDDDEKEIKAAKSCTEDVKRGVDGNVKNILRLEHNKKVISVFINDKKVYAFEDNDDLDGTGTGIIVQSRTFNRIKMELDDFGVIKK